MILLLAAVPLLIGVFWLHSMVKRHGAGPLLWRFLSGHPLDGQHRTNASWTRPATKVLHPTGHAVAWHHLPRGHRAVVRTGALASFAACLWGLEGDRRVTVYALAAIGAVVLALSALWIVRRIRAWKHERTYVQPLGYALAGVLGVPPPSLTVAPDRSRVAVGLGDSFTGHEGDKEAITLAVTAKLAIEAPDAEWKLHGRQPQVVFTRSQPPPAKVNAADILAEIKRAKPHEIVAGVGRRDETTKVSVDNDSPHMGLSMGSGDGKSVTARNFLSQQLYHGALGIVLDYKLISHQWARGLPNVAYAGTPEEIHQMLLWLVEEIGRRNQVALRAADIEGNVNADVGPRLFVVAEELNATQARLAAYWKREGNKGRSPASEALDEAMFVGRQVLCNILQIGQRLSAKASGSGDARENLGVKVFCDPSQSTWRMLCPELVMPPRSVVPAGHKGRLQVVTRREVRETQGAYWTGREARDFALSGTVAVPRWDMPLIAHVPGRAELESPGADQRIVSDTPPAVSGPSGAVTLAEACAAGVLPRSLQAARKAAQRDQDHPSPVGQRGNAYLYDVNDLYAWQASKARMR